MKALTPKMRTALGAIRAARIAWLSTESDLHDADASVHLPTANALEPGRAIRVDALYPSIVVDIACVSVTHGACGASQR